MRLLVIILLVLNLRVNPLLSQIIPLKRVCFPVDSVISSQHAASLILKTHLPQKTDSNNAESFQHWLLYEIQPGIPWQGETILSIPDYQINYIEIFSWDLNSDPELILKYGDEIDVNDYTEKTRTWQCKLNEDSIPKYLLVRYQRPGNRVQLLLQLFSKKSYLKNWIKNSQLYGFVYGILILYLVGLFLTLVFFNKRKDFGFYLLWVFVYSLYFFLTSGHVKYYIFPEFNGFFSALRVTAIIIGFFAMSEYSLIHYQRQKDLRFVSFVWYGWMLFALFMSVYNHFSAENVFRGFEKEFITTVRLLLLLFLVIQIYLPISHYRRKKEITYLTPLLTAALIFTLFYLYQTIRFEQINFDDYILSSIWLHITEIFIIAVGLGRYFYNEKKAKEALENENENLQLKLNTTQFEVRENERKRIAIDLHDDALNRIAILTQLIRGGHISKDEVYNTIKNITNDIKLYLSGVSPNWKNEMNIEDLVLSEIEPLLRKNNSQLELSITGSDNKLSGIKKLQLYRVIQEFVFNYLKHSKGNEVSIDLVYLNENLKCKLSENGDGYDVDSVTKGIGTLASINRIEIIGGSLKIKTSAGTGVLWDIQIPFEDNLQDFHLGKLQY